MPAALEAQRELLERFDVAAEVWSATSYKALRDDAMSVERWNRLHPGAQPRVPYVQRVLDRGEGPVVAVTDHVKLVADQVGRFVPEPYVPLGTDGFGFSDTRAALRRHFEVDGAHVVVAALWGLLQKREVKAQAVLDALAAYGLDTDAPDPRDG
jgi:pyruvate dehydrogenase E1 component